MLIVILVEMLAGPEEMDNIEATLKIASSCLQLLARVFRNSSDDLQKDCGVSLSVSQI